MLLIFCTKTRFDGRVGYFLSLSPSIIHYNLTFIFIYQFSVRFVELNFIIVRIMRKLEKKKETMIDRPSRLTDVGAGRSPRGIVAAAPHVLAIGVNRLLDDAVVVVANAVVSVVLVEVESRRAGDALPTEVLQPEIEVPASVGVGLVGGLLLVVKAGLVDGRSPPDPAQAALGDAPGPAQHLYPPAQGLS